MISQEKILQIQEMYINGFNKTQIAKQLDVSAATVRKYADGLSQEKDEMIGKTFGSLTVVKKLPKNPELVSRCVRYLCVCQCGKEIEANGNSLRTGHTTSCGCSRKGASVKDLTGQRFCKLLVVGPTDKRKDRKMVWECVCDCGRTTYLNSSELHHHKSCGCLSASYGEEIIDKLLSKMAYNYTTQYRIPECKSVRSLPFDFAIFDKDNNLKCLIEYQGDIHYKTTGGWNTPERLEQNQKRDEIKEEYCKQNNIQLIIIPYWDLEKINEEYLRKAIESNGLCSNS